MSAGSSSATHSFNRRVPASPRLRVAVAFCLLPFAFCLACRQDMHDQPKYKPLRPADAIGSISDGRSARPLVEGTVARGLLRDDVAFYTGRLASQATGASTTGTAEQKAIEQSLTRNQKPETGNQEGQAFQNFVTTFPIEITREALDRGQERFNIYCSVCHGRAGDGDGMVALRGFRKPPSYHIERLRQAPVGYLFDVITNGFGAMPDYAGSITPEDRWKIVAYIRALQLSQGANATQLDPSMREKLNNPPQYQGGPAQGEHR